MELELLREVRAAPDEDGPRLVYADWLLQQGNPVGELIIVQCAVARGEDDDVMRARERELLERLATRPGAPLVPGGYVRGFATLVTATSIEVLLEKLPEIAARHPFAALAFRDAWADETKIVVSADLSCLAILERRSSSVATGRETWTSGNDSVRVYDVPTREVIFQEDFEWLATDDSGLPTRGDPLLDVAFPAQGRAILLTIGVARRLEVRPL
jgi:uncharacterized protein (TIGR02996 family)